jgi:hypothetical protein
MIGRAPAIARAFTPSQMLGRQIRLGAQAEQSVKEAKVPTPASVSDRLRSKKQFHSSWAADLEQRLNVIDAIEAKALPIIEREMQDRESSVRSLEADALAIAEIALAIEGGNRGPTTTSVQSGNGSAGGEHHVTNQE